MDDWKEKLRPLVSSGAEPPAASVNPSQGNPAGRSGSRTNPPPPRTDNRTPAPGGRAKGAPTSAQVAAPAQSSTQAVAAGGGQRPQFQLGLDYTERAEEVIKYLKNLPSRDFNYQNFTTSKIRNILAMVSEIYNDVLIDFDEVLSMELQSRIEYLKVRLVYECGREPYVIKPFVNKAGLIELLNSIGDKRDNFLKFAKYMEALVAYHRFHGGKD